MDKFSNRSTFSDPGLRVNQLWTEQLYREYEQIAYTYRVRFRQVVIRVTELADKWALWDAGIRTILVNRRLITEYPWDVVIEILKHEMAHQLVTDTVGSAKPHGPEFVAACRKLGVADWAVSASGELPEKLAIWRERATSPEEERLLQRVEKLLALAGSSNEHEALLAMQRVQEMYAKYNIERLRRQGASDMVYLMLHSRKKRTDAVQSMIASILAEHFFVKVIHGRLYDARDVTHYAVMELMGTRENVLMAEYVHGFLTQQTQSLWRAYQKRGTGKSGRRSYMLGVLSGFAEKLAAMKKPKAEPTPEEKESVALMRVADQEVEGFVKRRHPRLVTRHWGGGRQEADAYEAGRAHGRELNLHRPIEDNGGNRGRLLPRG